MTKPVKPDFPPCPKCGEPRGKKQSCRNGCETYSASPCGTFHGGSAGGFYTRGQHFTGTADKEI